MDVFELADALKVGHLDRCRNSALVDPTRYRHGNVIDHSRIARGARGMSSLRFAAPRTRTWREHGVPRFSVRATALRQLRMGRQACSDPRPCGWTANHHA